MSTHASLHRDLVSAYVASHLARSSDRFESTGLAWFRTGAASEELNGVLYVDNALAVDEAQALFADLPTLWHIWPGITPPPIEDLLVSSGVQFVEQEPLMSRTLGRDYELDIEVEEAASHDDVAEMVELWMGRARDHRLDGVVRALTAFPYGPDESRHFLLHRREGVAVACANVFVVDGIAAIENVITLLAHRNRGLGTSMTKAALNRARGSGAVTAMLTASPDGERIYESLGFTTTGVVRRYRQN